MKRLLKLLGFLLLLLVLSVPSAIAQNSEFKPPTATPDPDVSYIRLSAELAAAARDARDTILMLAAAMLDEMAVTQDASHEKVGGSADDTDIQEKSGADNLFALAEEYAGTNEELLALVADAKSRNYTPKGLRGGAEVVYDIVRARDIDVWRLVFRGGEYAELCVVGDGDTDLDLYVYDENGNLICSDTDYTDRNYCSWTPRWTGPFRVVIENLGTVYNEYRLATN